MVCLGTWAGRCLSAASPVPQHRKQERGGGGGLGASLVQVFKPRIAIDDFWTNQKMMCCELKIDRTFPILLPHNMPYPCNKCPQGSRKRLHCGNDVFGPACTCTHSTCSGSPEMHPPHLGSQVYGNNLQILGAVKNATTRNVICPPL